MLIFKIGTVEWHHPMCLFAPNKTDDFEFRESGRRRVWRATNFKGWKTIGFEGMGSEHGRVPPGH